MTYYVVTRSGDVHVYGNQTSKPLGYYVTTNKAKAYAKSRSIENGKKDTYSTNTNSKSSRWNNNGK